MPGPCLLCIMYIFNHCFIFLNKNCLLRCIRNIFLPLWVCCGSYSMYKESTSLNAFSDFFSFTILDLSTLDMIIIKTKKSYATSLLCAFLPTTQVESGSSLSIFINLSSIQIAVIVQLCEAWKWKIAATLFKKSIKWILYAHLYVKLSPPL